MPRTLDPTRKAAEWKPIQKACIEAATAMGHTLGITGRRATPSVKTAMCNKCFGCCWVARNATRGFDAGGRLVKYRCGTPEAAGRLEPPNA